MGKPLVAYVKIKKVNAVTITDTDDLVAAEEPLEIRLGYGNANDRAQKSISVTMRNTLVVCMQQLCLIQKVI